MLIMTQARQHVPTSKSEAGEKFARVGYAAKGALYMTLGLISVQAAFGGGSPKGSKGAMRSIADQPFGAVLLGITVLGLIGYTLWRAYQAIKDPENAGTDAKGIAKRVGYALSALSHAALSALGIQMLVSAGSGGNNKKTVIAEMLQSTAGQFAVGALGVFVIGAGLRQIYKAVTTKFAKELKTNEMGETIETTAIWAGRIGFAARGIVFPLIGYHLISAALSENPGQAKGLGVVLMDIGGSTWGSIALVVVASGLAAYGLYQLMLARYRRIEVNI